MEFLKDMQIKPGSMNLIDEKEAIKLYKEFTDTKYREDLLQIQYLASVILEEKLGM